MAPDHLGELWAIVQTIIADGTSLVDDDRTTAADFARGWIDRGGEQWVGLDAGRVVGGYTVRANQPGRGGHVATATYVVAPSARGRGVGAQLGSHSLVRARALGFLAMQYNLVISTNTVAVELWQRLGFEIAGTARQAFRHPTLGLVDAYIMSRTL